ncbi:MAG TPA: pyridoxal phosphate-dependent aminotransferase [Solirubrobacteraceae bacterium]|nr:pyridoxal phosphate-dependent aminotransferase [Solirubrobacteraceae bacterium]
MSSVLTWGGPAAAGDIASERLRALRASHSAMWNYVTYRDAIGIVGLDPDELYPGGTTRLPAGWADLGWLICFAGPPPAAVEAMRAAVGPVALSQYAPDLVEPLRDEAAALLGRPRDAAFEVIGAEGAQAGIALSLLAAIDPGDEVVLGDPGYFHLPSAIIAASGRPVPVPAGRRSGFRIDVEAVAAAVGPRTRAICIVDPSNPYGAVLARDELEALAALAEREGLLLVHDVTHAPLVIDPATEHAALTTLTDRAVATFSVSHCWGLAGARLGFLAGPRDLLRGCLQLRAALMRMSTSPVAQQGALAALRDPGHLPRAERAIRRNLVVLEDTLAAVPGLRLAVRPRRGLSCAVEIDPTLTTAQELMVALFARRIAVYPGDGLGEESAATTIRLNLSHPEVEPLERLRAELAGALAEAAAGRWREPVADLLDAKGTDRAARLAGVVRGRTGR